MKPAVILAFALAAAGLATVSLAVTYLSGSKLHETEIAFAYVCGFRAGQVAITSRLPSLFTAEEDHSKAKGACIDMAKIAVEHGIDLAKESLP